MLIGTTRLISHIPAALPAESRLGYGFGEDALVQFEPFQCSMSDVQPVVAPAKERPTAVQALDEAQDTPYRSTTFPGLTVGWMVQAEPFHRSASDCVLELTGL
jgi:hypothetical protein